MTRSNRSAIRRLGYVACAKTRVMMKYVALVTLSPRGRSEDRTKTIDVEMPWPQAVANSKDKMYATVSNGETQ